jgi:hypothetical protein
MNTVHDEESAPSQPHVVLERFDDYLFSPGRPLVSGLLSAALICVAACSLTTGVLWVAFLRRHEGVWCVAGALGAAPRQLCVDFGIAFLAALVIVGIGASITMHWFGVLTHWLGLFNQRGATTATRYGALLWLLITVAGVSVCLGIRSARSMGYRSIFHVWSKGFVTLPGTVMWPVVLQASLVSLLLAGGVVAILLLQGAGRTDLGVNTDGVLYVRVTARDEGFVRTYFPVVDEIRESLEGIGPVAIASRLPVGEEGRQMGAGRPSSASGGPAVLRVVHQQVGGDYFDILGLRMLSGRSFTTQDLLWCRYVPRCHQASGRSCQSVPRSAPARPACDFSCFVRLRSRWPGERWEAQFLAVSFLREHARSCSWPPLSQRRNSPLAVLSRCSSRLPQCPSRWRWVHEGSQLRLLEAGETRPVGAKGVVPNRLAEGPRFASCSSTAPPETKKTFTRIETALARAS